MVVIRKEDEGTAAQAIGQEGSLTDKAVMVEYVLGGLGVGNRGQVDVCATSDSQVPAGGG